jgi:hypothetical protein
MGLLNSSSIVVTDDQGIAGKLECGLALASQERNRRLLKAPDFQST